MKQIIKLSSMYIMLMALTLGFVCCSDDDDEEKPTVNNYSYNTLSGHWINEVTDEIAETLSFNAKGLGSIVFYDLIDNEFGIMAFGTYTLEENKIVASYTDVSVDMEDGASTWHGFTDNQNKTVVYTIQSCDGEKLVLKDESGKVSTFEKYADVK